MRPAFCTVIPDGAGLLPGSVLALLRLSANTSLGCMAAELNVGAGRAAPAGAITAGAAAELRGGNAAGLTAAFDGGPSNREDPLPMIWPVRCAVGV